MKPPVHRGDGRERRMLLWIVLALLVLAMVGGYALWQFRDQFMLLFSVNPDEGVGMVRQVIRGLVLLLAAQALAIAWYLGRKATAVCRTQRFPLRDSRTVLSLRVREGEEAVRLGRLGQITASMFALVGLVALWIGLR